jgi:RNA polymerase sigma-70 factor (ECF subfamily)
MNLTDQGQLLERHRGYLMLLARVHLNPQHPAKFDSSDIVQQTLLDAFAKREQFRGSTEAEFSVWLREILKNNLLDALREQKRGKRDIRRERSLEAAISESFSRTHEWLAAVQSSPSQRVVKQEDLFRLSEALTELPEAQREMIVLHHLQGRKLADVAALTGRSESSVAGLLFRGLRELRTLLDDDRSTNG